MNHLENEKKNLIKVMNQFLDGINLEEEQYEGRPRTSMINILKSLLIMSYHGWSYRRANGDIEALYEGGHITKIPKRSTLNKYILDLDTQKILTELIKLSSLSFADIEDCVIIDSTWFSQFQRICGAHKRKVSDRTLRLPSLAKTRKIHLVCFSKSKAVLIARTSKGTVHDNKFFLDIMEDAVESGFKIRTLIADSAYSAKENFIWLEENNIKNVFIDFRKNSIVKGSKSKLRAERLTLFRENPEEWHETYKYRILIEGLMSTIKRKGRFHYLRSKKPESQDCELLLKVLWHNLTIIAKHYY